MIFAFSDVHGHYDLMEKRMKQIIPFLEDKKNMLILLGDFIDRGKNSYQCLKVAFELQKKYGEERVVVLKGNHEVWLRDFLFGNDDIWLEKDSRFHATKTFLTDKQNEKLNGLSNRNDQIEYVREFILANHKELMTWMANLKGYYETKTQIFVHAGVDEDIPAEEIDWCALATPEYMLVGKYPPTKGYFYKDIIAGHVSVDSISKKKGYGKIYLDGQSHYYIDGSVTRNHRLLCLVYDEEKEEYFELLEDGRQEKIEGNRRGQK